MRAFGQPLDAWQTIMDLKSRLLGGSSFSLLLDRRLGFMDAALRKGATKGRVRSAVIHAAHDRAAQGIQP